MKKTTFYLLTVASLSIHLPTTKPMIANALRIAPISAPQPLIQTIEAPAPVLKAYRYIPHRNRLAQPKTYKPAPKISKAWEKMVAGVKTFEGYRAKPYRCCGGRLTIGYGHTGAHTRKGYLTKEQAGKVLEEELEATKAKVLDIVEVPLSEPQLAALTSFTFNCGPGALKKLVDQPGRLNDGNYESVEEVMPLYRKAGGKIREGLVKRRAWELEIWSNA